MCIHDKMHIKVLFPKNWVEIRSFSNMHKFTDFLSAFENVTQIQGISKEFKEQHKSCED